MVVVEVFCTRRNVTGSEGSSIKGSTRTASATAHSVMMYVGCWQRDCTVGTNAQKIREGMDLRPNRTLSMIGDEV